MWFTLQVRGPSGIVLRQRLSGSTPVVQPVADGNSTWRDRRQMHQIDHEDFCNNTEGSHT